jgi:predicted amidophosphoribosyltransferase|tara:strand:+ start:4743 stop:4949 length:207 start_codon:yes stop_codon:yes gene_type:complete
MFMRETNKLNLGSVSNCAECSGCGKRLPTVNRHMFDGMCADCTDKALYDYDFAKRAERRNEELKRHCC